MTDKVDCAIWIWDNELQRKKRIRLQTLLNRVNHTLRNENQTYFALERKRGPKGNKVNQTRRRSSFYYLSGNACSLNCANDWFEEYGNRAVDYFGRITQPIQLTENNAWRKRYRYNWERTMRGARGIVIIGNENKATEPSITLII